jgi:hypothetical protein
MTKRTENRTNDMETTLEKETDEFAKVMDWRLCPSRLCDSTRRTHINATQGKTNFHRAEHDEILQQRKEIRPPHYSHSLSSAIVPSSNGLTSAFIYEWIIQ